MSKPAIFNQLSLLATQDAQNFNNLYKGVFLNDFGITPQAVTSALGVNAATYFNMMEAKKQLAVHYDAALIAPERLEYPFTVTINNDGTVTLTDLPA